MTDRELIANWWKDAWTDGLWAASWEKSIAGLTPAQAAWTPQAGRHSIWQIVSHMIFWREDALRRLTDPAKPTAEQLAQQNFPQITDLSQAAWNQTVARFAKSQQAIADVFAKDSTDISRLMYMIPHDCYHFGQINLLRAMQGFAPIE